MNITDIITGKTYKTQTGAIIQKTGESLNNKEVIVVAMHNENEILCKVPVGNKFMLLPFSLAELTLI